MIRAVSDEVPRLSTLTTSTLELCPQLGLFYRDFVCQPVMTAGRNLRPSTEMLNPPPTVTPHDFLPEQLIDALAAPINKNAEGQLYLIDGCRRSSTEPNEKDVYSQTGARARLRWGAAASVGCPQIHMKVKRCNRDV